MCRKTAHTLCGGQAAEQEQKEDGEERRPKRSELRDWRAIHIGKATPLKPESEGRVGFRKACLWLGLSRETVEFGRGRRSGADAVERKGTAHSNELLRRLESILDPGLRRLAGDFGVNGEGLLDHPIEAEGIHHSGAAPAPQRKAELSVSGQALEPLGQRLGITGRDQ